MADKLTYNFVDRVLDLIILMAKYHIFPCRCLKVIPNVTCFLGEVKQRAAVEKIYLLMKGNLTMYFSLWLTYFLIINDMLLSCRLMSSDVGKHIRDKLKNTLNLKVYKRLQHS